MLQNIRTFSNKTKFKALLAIGASAVLTGCYEVHSPLWGDEFASTSEEVLFEHYSAYNEGLIQFTCAAASEDAVLTNPTWAIFGEKTLTDAFPLPDSVGQNMYLTITSLVVPEECWQLNESEGETGYYTAIAINHVNDDEQRTPYEPSTDFSFDAAYFDQSGLSCVKSSYIDMGASSWEWNAFVGITCGKEEDYVVIKANSNIDDTNKSTAPVIAIVKDALIVEDVEIQAVDIDVSLIQ